MAETSFTDRLFVNQCKVFIDTSSDLMNYDKHLINEKYILEWLPFLLPLHYSPYRHVGRNVPHHRPHLSRYQIHLGRSALS